MNASNVTESRRMISFFVYLSLAVAAVLLPLSTVHATSIGTNVSVTGTTTLNGNTTIGDATSDTLTVTARLAADLNPNANNTIDLGEFSLAYKDIYVSSTAFVGDLSDLLYVDAVNSRIGIASSTPSAKLSIGTANASSTLDVPQLCIRTTVDIGGTDSQVYMWPCIGAGCPTAAAAASGWATSTVSCY